MTAASEVRVRAALSALLEVIATDRLVPESVSYMVQAREALAAPSTPDVIGPETRELAATQTCDGYADGYLEDVLSMVYDEVRSARAKWAAFHSRHEAYAVIAEELDEYWELVRYKDRQAEDERTELVQTAAMCVAAVVELCHETIEPPLGRDDVSTEFPEDRPSSSS